MKLKSCHIENFGKISDLHIDFTEGINVLKEPNGWGKSTLAAFIKVMLFGFDSKKEPGAFEKERNRYRPWQGGVYGGELDFTAGSRTYRVSRTFGRTEKNDEFHIYDLETNLESVDFTSNLGEELFDLDSMSFKRSIFIAQNDCESQTSDAINAKLGNLAENTNDINNYDTAQTALKNLANRMSPNRATGSIRKRSNQLTELSQNLKGFEAADAAVFELKNQIKNAEMQKEALSLKRDAYVKELRSASEESRRTEQKKTYQVLCAEYAEKQEVAEAFRQMFPKGIPEEEEIGAHIKIARKMEEEQTLLRHMELTAGEEEDRRKLASMFKNSVPTGEEIDSVIEECSALPQLREERTMLLTQIAERENKEQQEEAPAEKVSRVSAITVIGWLLEVCGLIAIIFGIIFRKSFTYASPVMLGGLWLLLVATILVIIGIMKKNKARRALKLKQLEQWQRQETKEMEICDLRKLESKNQEKMESICGRTKAFLERYQISCDVTGDTSRLYELKNQIQEYRRLSEKQKAYEEAEKKWRAYKEQLETFGKGLGIAFGEAITEEISFLQAEAAKYSLAQAAAEDARLKKEAFEKGTDIDGLYKETNGADSLEEINQQIHLLDGEMEGVRNAIEQYNRQLEDLQEQLDYRDEKERELAECLQLQEEETRKHGIIVLTQEYLQMAKEQFTARYMAPISDAFRKYYRLLLGAEEDDWIIDANIAIKRKELGELRDTKWLSAGYQDLIGVCMRLALVDAMYQEEKPFLILDDPFVNLDEEKTAHGMELLQKVSEEYQTIYFTCHQSREPGIE